MYSVLSFKSAFSQSHILTPDAGADNSILKTVAICLAFTWFCVLWYDIVFDKKNKNNVHDVDPQQV